MVSLLFNYFFNKLVSTNFISQHSSKYVIFMKESFILIKIIYLSLHPSMHPDPWKTSLGNKDTFIQEHLLSLSKDGENLWHLWCPTQHDEAPLGGGEPKKVGLPSPSSQSGGAVSGQKGENTKVPPSLPSPHPSCCGRSIPGTSPGSLVWGTPPLHNPNA